MDNITRWSINDSNLQSYRGFFLTSQSIMVAVGAILLNKNAILTIAIAAIAVFQIFYVWIPVIYYRALIVDFYKYNMDKQFDSNGDLITNKSDSNLQDKTYCKNRKIRKKVNAALTTPEGKPFKNMRESRRKIDITLPISMLSIWLIFVIESVLSLF